MDQLNDILHKYYQIIDLKVAFLLKGDDDPLSPFKIYSTYGKIQHVENWTQKWLD